MTNSDKISEVLNKCKDMLTMKVDDFEAKYYPKAGLPTIVHEIDEALKLLSSPPIVGVEPVAWMRLRDDLLDPSLYTKREMARAIELRRHKPEEFIPLYLSAQAPQSSPAPSVIEATVENVLSEHAWKVERHIELTDWRYKWGAVTNAQLPDMLDDLKTILDTAWDQAKASRPSVTAPAQGVMPQVDKIMEVVRSCKKGNSGYCWKVDPNELEDGLSALLKEK